MSEKNIRSRIEVLNAKLKNLEVAIAGRKSLLVMYSGGVDSTLLAAVAHRILGKNARCVILDSPMISRHELENALQQANRYGYSCSRIEFPILHDAAFRENPLDRCYLCRTNASVKLRDEAKRTGITWIADGLTTSDQISHRHGMKAAEEAGIIHPFIEAEISKDDVRDIAKMLGLDVWDKPSTACLATRIPYGEYLDMSKLDLIEQAENILRHAGFLQARARLHGSILRIEVPSEEFSTILAQREELVEHLKMPGLTFITLDLEGFRSGSMDEVMNPTSL